MRSLVSAAIAWGLAAAVLLPATPSARGDGADANATPLPDARDSNQPGAALRDENTATGLCPARVLFESEQGVKNDEQGAKKERTWSLHAPVLYLQKPQLRAESESLTLADWRKGATQAERFDLLFGLVSGERVFRTPQEIEMYNIAQVRIGDPGPELPGKFDTEIFHWMDSEYFRTTPVTADYSARFYDGEPAGPGGRMGFTQQDLSLRWSHLELSPIVGAMLKARDLEFTSRPVFPNTGGRFPSNLSNIQAGVSGILPPGLWNVAVGSTSDKPFASGDEMTLDVSYFIGEPPEKSDSWGFYVDWQNNRDFLNGLPIPGYVYRYKQGDWFTMVAGFPDNAFAWRPVPWLEMSGSYSFPRTAHSEIGVRPCPDIKVFGGFDWTNERFFRSNRQDVDDRLWYFEKTLSGGLRWEKDHRIYLEARGGWAFDRFWFEGATYEDRLFNRINVGDGPFLSLSFGARF